MLDAEVIAYIQSKFKGSGSITPKDKAKLDSMRITDDKIEFNKPVKSSEFIADRNTYFIGPQVGIKDVGTALGYTLAEYDELRILPYIKLGIDGEILSEPSTIRFSNIFESNYGGNAVTQSRNDVNEFIIRPSHNILIRGMKLVVNKERPISVKFSYNKTGKEIYSYNGLSVPDMINIWTPFALYKDEEIKVSITVEQGSIFGDMDGDVFTPYINLLHQVFHFKELQVANFKMGVNTPYLNIPSEGGPVKYITKTYPSVHSVISGTTQQGSKKLNYSVECPLHNTLIRNMSISSDRDGYAHITITCDSNAVYDDYISWRAECEKDIVIPLGMMLVDNMMTIDMELYELGVIKTDYQDQPYITVDAQEIEMSEISNVI